MYQNIIELSSEKNPKDEFGQIPLINAALHGHLEICKYILEDLDNKNPADNYGVTPLHFAAANGYKKTCEIIMEHLENKNPIDNLGLTPLHYAALKGSDVFELDFHEPSQAGHLLSRAKLAIF